MCDNKDKIVHTLNQPKDDTLATQVGSDEQLMLDYQAGNVHAFEVLYSKHKGPLYRYFVRQLHHQP